MSTSFLQSFHAVPIDADQHHAELLSTLYFSQLGLSICEMPITASQFVVKAVKVVQVITVVCSFRAYKHIMVIKDFQEGQQVIIVIICCSKQMIHLILCYVPGSGKGDPFYKSVQLEYDVKLLRYRKKVFIQRNYTGEVTMKYQHIFFFFMNF